MIGHVDRGDWTRLQVGGTSQLHLVQFGDQYDDVAQVELQVRVDRPDVRRGWTLAGRGRPGERYQDSQGGNLPRLPN